MSSDSRVVVWFSCGAASAVAAKLALDKYPNAEIVYCDTGAEHPDNVRFLKDCERWYGKEIKVLKSEHFQDTWDVFEKTKYLVGVRGARCTTELKKNIRFKYQLPNDLQVFGFTSDEKARSDRFKENNFDIQLSFPLIEHNLNKQQCFDFLTAAGIALPQMYLLGYKNNNCIGCVKGGAGYWNKIRRDFPDTFKRMAEVERKLNVAILHTRKDGVRKKLFLDELPPTMGRYESELSIGCGVLCDIPPPEDIEE